MQKEAEQEEGVVREFAPNCYLQDRILFMLASTEYASVSQLARDVESARSSTSRAVGALEGQGFIERREQALHITELGLVAMKEAHCRWFERMSVEIHALARFKVLMSALQKRGLELLSQGYD